jgi:hypothetical protein
MTSDEHEISQRIWSLVAWQMPLGGRWKKSYGASAAYSSGRIERWVRTINDHHGHRDNFVIDA